MWKKSYEVDLQNDNSMKNFKNPIKDEYGLLYSTELLLSIILLVFIIGIMANLSDDMNEKILSEEELSSLEGIAIETSDYLLNNPGSPENWEDDENLDNGIVSSRIIPGLAIKNKMMENGQFYDESTNEEEVISNSISYNKLLKIKNNYNELIDKNLFNNRFKSSMAIYPLNSEIKPIVMGDESMNNGLNVNDNGGYDNVNDNDIAVVRRTVQCNFYSNFAIFNFNDLELFGDAYKRDEICNHDSNPNLENHSNDIRSYWLCKSFRIYKKSLENYNYYLISDEDVKNSNSYWILESLNRPNENMERLNREVIDLNPFFSEDLGNSSNEIYYIHFNVDKNHANDFKTVLVAVPKNMTHDLMVSGELKYDYFRANDVDFRLKIRYA